MSIKRFEPHDSAQLTALTGAPLARFSSRAFAFIVDLVLFTIILALVNVSVRYAQVGSLPQTVELHLFDRASLWTPVALMLYFGLLTYFGNGQTPGKRLMRIRVVSLLHERVSLWHSIERALGYIASTLEGGFGFFQYFIHPNAQTVHDRIAETIVVDARKSIHD